MRKSAHTTRRDENYFELRCARLEIAVRELENKLAESKYGFEQAVVRLKEIADQRYVTQFHDLKEALREIYEVYAGSDGFIHETAPETYQQRLIKQMADIAATQLGKGDVKDD
jgi:hypothetical protein